MRHDVAEESAAREVLEKEVSSLLVQLHRVQLQLHSNSETPDSDSIRDKLVRARSKEVFQNGNTIVVIVS